MIRFLEVTNTSGISHEGSSYGASWGDFNGDSYPDLFIGNHSDSGILYLNGGDGTFKDITSQVGLQDGRADTHGAAWADFDKDGDQDLILLVGGGRGFGVGKNLIFVNENGQFIERASELGIDYPISRGRTPLWLDFDKDGQLDLLTGAIPRPDGQAPPAIFSYTDDGFENVSSTAHFDVANAKFALLSDLSGDGNLDVVLKSDSLGIYDISSNIFEDITDTLVSESIRSHDFVSGDFNGDLRPDLYSTQNTQFFVSDLVQVDFDTAKARIVSEGDQKGASFSSSGDVEFNLDIGSIPELEPPVYIGSEGVNFNSSNFTLSSSDPEAQGIFPHIPGVDRGIYIGYDSELQQWQILVSSPDRINFHALINGDNPLTDLTEIGFDSTNITPRNDQLLISTENGLIDQTQISGIDTIPIFGNSVATGDFDNDMDLDLYLVTSSAAGNLPNILYENQGDGTFIAVPNAGGAEGTNLGVGDSVTVADYDLDGFLDVFITNGGWPPIFSLDAPSQLFHNQGNENHWLGIDLEGVSSNRDAIGAQVFVTADGVTQLREQSGGIHEKSQNHQRLHFGLADNTIVDEILIKWPNGQEQIINNVAADQFLHIIEPSY